MDVNKFPKCPVCNNAYINPEAIVCRYCGTSSINYCTNEECRHPSEPDAYYCEICGSTTLLGDIEHH